MFNDAARWVCGCLLRTAVVRVGCCTSLLYGAPAKTDRSKVGGGPQLLGLRRLSPREPPVPVAYVLAQLGLLNTQLFTGDLRVRVAITVSLRVSLHEHDGLLICAVSSDGVAAGVVLMISPSLQPVLLRRDLMIRSYRRGPARSRRARLTWVWSAGQDGHSACGLMYPTAVLPGFPVFSCRGGRCGPAVTGAVQPMRPAAGLPIRP